MKKAPCDDPLINRMRRDYEDRPTIEDLIKDKDILRRLKKHAYQRKIEQKAYKTRIEEKYKRDIRQCLNYARSKYFKAVEEYQNRGALISDKIEKKSLYR